MSYITKAAPKTARESLERFDFDLNGLAFAFAALGEPGSETFGKAFGT